MSGETSPDITGLPHLTMEAREKKKHFLSFFGPVLILGKVVSKKGKGSEVLTGRNSTYRNPVDGEPVQENI